VSDYDGSTAANGEERNEFLFGQDGSGHEMLLEAEKASALLALLLGEWSVQTDAWNKLPACFFHRRRSRNGVSF
jgi:hypothetical protein